MAGLDLPSGPVDRGVFEPGWRRSEHIKRIAGTDSCQTAHLGYVVSGRMHVVMDDGSEAECGPGDAVTSHLATTPGSSATKHVCSSTSARSRTTRSRNKPASADVGFRGRPMHNYQPRNRELGTRQACRPEISRN
jgi:hypothetical protein